VLYVTPGTLSVRYYSQAAEIMRGCLIAVRIRGRDRPGPQAPRTTGEALNGGLLGAEVPSPMALRARCQRLAGINNDDTKTGDG
jgi:hypothetical protein